MAQQVSVSGLLSEMHNLFSEYANCYGRSSIFNDLLCGLVLMGMVRVMVWVMVRIRVCVRVRIRVRVGVRFSFVSWSGQV